MEIAKSFFDILSFLMIFKDILMMFLICCFVVGKIQTVKDENIKFALEVEKFHNDVHNLFSSTKTQLSTVVNLIISFENRLNVNEENINKISKTLKETNSTLSSVIILSIRLMRCVKKKITFILIKKRFVTINK